jgi:signal transduction histidine kinase
MAGIRILIAEDEEVVQRALVELVSSDPEMEIVAVVDDAEQAIEAARRERPDVALVDVKMPGGGGPHAAREILRASSSTRVLALSAYEDRRSVLEMLRAGVVGYLVKGTPATEILGAIRRTMRGEGALSVEVTADVIHELAEALDRSEQLATQLHDLDRTKSELIQILSHELFTPITAIQGFAVTVAERGHELPPEDVRAMVEGVQRASQRLRRLVGNLGAAARLDREGVEVTTRPVRVGELLERALASFPSDTERLRAPAAEEAVLTRRLWADLDLAAQALVVGIENALGFGGESPVQVRVLPGDAAIRIAVVDRGPGVPEGRREAVFDAFAQLDASTTREHEGLGIGLYLARRIMRAQGGDLELGGTPGGGATLVYTFTALREGA